MQINFPNRGDVLFSANADGAHSLVSAPLEASFPLASPMIALGQPYPVMDSFGTKAIYRLESVYANVEGVSRGTGILIGIEARSLGQRVVTEAYHDARLSYAIDQSFEAGRQVGYDQALEEAEADEPALTINAAGPVEVHIHVTDDNEAHSWPPRFGPIGGAANDGL